MQEQKLRDYCRLTDIEILDLFIDFGKSGKNTTGRPQFTRMMNIIKTGEKSELPSMVLCTKLDRFARSLVDLHINISQLIEKGVTFKTLNQDFDLSKSSGRLMLSVMGAFAEFERDINSERTKEGYRAAIERGEICHRPKKELSKKKVIEYLDTGLSATAISKIFDVKPGTIKNRLNEWGFYFDDTQNKWIKQKN
jgi:DNA invertase Pin-like site-specific DNA recombinase